MAFLSVFIAFFVLQKRYLKEKNEMTVSSESVIHFSSKIHGINMYYCTNVHAQ